MNAKQIVNLFGGLRPMATALGHQNPTTIQYWVKKGIPRWRNHEILAAAKSLRLKLKPADLEAANK